MHAHHSLRQTRGFAQAKDKHARLCSIVAPCHEAHSFIKSMSIEADDTFTLFCYKTAFFKKIREAERRLGVLGPAFESLVLDGVGDVLKGRAGSTLDAAGKSSNQAHAWLRSLALQGLVDTMTSWSAETWDTGAAVVANDLMKVIQILNGLGIEGVQ